jgi:glucose dehydrogenase
MGQRKEGQPPGTSNGEWEIHTADLRGSKYSPLDQVNPSNFGRFESSNSVAARPGASM